MTEQNKPLISVRNLSVGYDNIALIQNMNFDINQGEIFVVMGVSGCGKSTLLRSMIGLIAPISGSVIIDNIDFWKTDDATRNKLLQKVGILYQGGALFSTMTLAENIALPLEQYTSLSSSAIADIVSLKLSLVGLAGFEQYYPSELSGGMKKRAGLARALALDPKIVFFDEPSAGLDPITSSQLDDLILELNESLGATFVIVTHELFSIFKIATNSIYLDSETKSILAQGNPNELLKNSLNPKVSYFLTRGDNVQLAR